MWEIGLLGGSMPSFNVILGGGSLATVFMTPPTPLPPNPQAAFDFLLRVDFDRDAPKINATDHQFEHSAWGDISARSSDLRAFHARDGKMIVFHGVSDPVFSINDTIDWWREVDRDNAGQAARFIRLFPIPGMNHCEGGDATDQFDVLAPLMQWVEQGKAPGRIVAGADPAAPWPRPGRSGPGPCAPIRRSRAIAAVVMRSGRRPSSAAPDLLTSDSSAQEAWLKDR
jgi:hypothetical protein